MTSVAGILIDDESHGLRGPLGLVRVTRTEWQVLTHLVAHEGRMVRREVLLAEVWGPSYADTPALLHDAISRLRGRFRQAGAVKQPIQTLHGIGYRLDR